MSDNMNIADVGYFLSFTPEEKEIVAQTLTDAGYGEGAGELKRWVLDNMLEESEADEPDVADRVRRYVSEHPEEILHIAEAGKQALKSAASSILSRWASTVRQPGR